MASEPESARASREVGPPPGGPSHWWGRIERTVLLNLATFLTVFATCIMLLEAISRSSLSHSYFWAEESVRYLMLWAFFLTIGCAGRAGHMIRTEMLVDHLPQKLRQLCHILSSAFGVIFAGVLLYAAIPQVIRYKSIGMMTDSNLDLPMWILFLAMPIGAVLMCIYYLGGFMDALRGIDPYHLDEPSPEAGAASKDIST
ncbi:MAG: TRAP transporter small permease [Pseudorhodobacter sp.]